MKVVIIMEIKLILYILSVPFILWLLESININGIFKKNKERQIKILYIVAAFILSYLLVNFITDFVEVSNFF